jgi:hypothetical protein
VWSSRRWAEHFRRNAGVPAAVPWEQGAGLTLVERDLVGPSVQVFQQGEAQEGGHFFRCARAHAERAGDLDYAEAHALFMAEEHRHGADLARFLGLAGVPTLTRRSWLAWAFCWCGSRGGLEPTLLVVLMSEVIAEVYYAALRRATGSAVLRRLCARILRDEKAHVRFQCEVLAGLRRGRPGWLLAVTHLGDRLLFAAACLACWSCHRRVLRAGGLGFAAFRREALRKLRRTWRLKDPCDYAWGEAVPAVRPTRRRGTTSSLAGASS